MKDGDRIIRVNGTFIDALPHSEVVELVRNSGASVAFHILGEAAYKEAKEQGVSLSQPPHSAAVANGVVKQAPKPKLCYLLNSSSGYNFSLRSVKSDPGMFITDVMPDGVAAKAGVKVKDRVVEVNGENVEDFTHDQVVEKVQLASHSIMFLLVDEDTDRYYKTKHMKVEACLSTTVHLPLKPRIVKMTKGDDGYGFLLRKELDMTGHYIKDIDRGSPAERAGLKEMDRLVAVDGQEVDSCTHEQVVEAIRQSGKKCCLLVVDKDTDQMYKQGKVSPLLFWEEMKDSTSPPSYTEALNLPAPVQAATPVQPKEEELKPKLCRMERLPDGYGFRLNGVEGVFGQYIKGVVKGGAADIAGLEDEDIVVEVNGVNVEQSTHDEVVEIIHNSGQSLEMLVATRPIYEQLKAKGVTITRMLLEEVSYVQVHFTATQGSSRRERDSEEARPETPTQQARDRGSSVSSTLSEDSVDVRL